MTEPLLSALVSTYASERYLRGCLDSLLAQTLGERVEIVVVDSCSPEGEGAIVREYQRRHPNVRYLRTEVREPTSVAFDRGIGLARGRYLTTANADDRHHPDFARRMVAVLDQHPEAAIAYADSAITHRDNETWATHTAARRYAWPDYTHTTALSCCLFGAQPVWRRDVHGELGGFDPRLVRANDQDMFLRISLQHGALHVRETLGLFLMRDDSVSGAGNRRATLEEVLGILRRFRTTTPLEVLFPALREHAGDPEATAAAWFELGNLAALGPYTDAALALDCYRNAVALPLTGDAALRVRGAFARNGAAILGAAGAVAEAQRALRLCQDDAAAGRNERRLAAARAAGRSCQLRELEFAELDHAVVRASRTTRAVVLGDDGRTRWTPSHEQRPWDVFDGPNGAPLDPAQIPAAAAERVAVAVPTLPAAAIPQRTVLLVAYGWAESGGGTMLPRAFAHGLAAAGDRVAVFYAAAAPAPDLPAYGLRHHHEGEVELFGLHNRRTGFYELEHPEREIDDPAARVAFEGLLDELQPDVVHFWNLHGLGMSLPAAAKARGLPTVYSSNNYWPLCPRLYFVSERLERCTGAGSDGTRCARCLGAPGHAPEHAARAAAGVRMLRDHLDVHLAVSHRVAELYVQNGDDPAHVRVLRQEPPRVVDIWASVGAHRPVVECLRRPLRVGFLGSVMPHKGVHVLVDALQLLPAGTVQCVALGDLAPDYHRVLASRDPGRRVHFHGRYDQAVLPGLLAKFDVMVVPSVWDDNAPFVVAEALAARCPVVGSRIGGIPDFVHDGRNGLLFAPGDAEDLARALARFAAEPTLLGRLQRGIEPPRGLPAFVADVRAVYEELLVPAHAT